MDDIVISYDPHIDIVNMELFDRYGTSMPLQLRHRCVVCRQPECRSWYAESVELLGEE